MKDGGTETETESDMTSIRIDPAGEMHGETHSETATHTDAHGEAAFNMLFNPSVDKR